VTDLFHVKARVMVGADQVTTPETAGRDSGAPWLWPLAGTLVLAAFLYIYSPSFAPLLHYWERAEYGHGYVIPFIAILFAWHDLSERRPMPASSWRGLVFLLIGFGCLLISQLSTFNAVAVYGLILGLVGLSDCLLGRQVTRVLAPAFIYLLFAVPLPDFLYVDLSARMQLVSSTLGVHLLELAAVPVFQDGNVIDLGGLKLQVAEACSGLRYLFPLASLGFLAAYLLKDAFWKRAVVLLSTLPITILLNAARIAVIGITADRWGPQMAEGLIHVVEGWVVFGLCAFCLLLEIAILRRIGPRGGRFRLDYLGPASFPLLAARPAMSRPGWVAGALVAIFLVVMALGTGGGYLGAAPATEVTLRPDLAGIVPLRLGDWAGHRRTLDADVVDALGLTDYVVTDYFTDDQVNDPAVNLYIGYWASQSVGSAAHSPANCIPGGGWLIMDKRAITLPSQSAAGTGLRVNRLLIGHDDVRQLVYYWFDQRGRDLVSEWSVKWYLLRDRIVTGRSDGFLLRLVTPIVGQNEAEADRRLQQFLDMSRLSSGTLTTLSPAVVTQ